MRALEEVTPGYVPGTGAKRLGPECHIPVVILKLTSPDLSPEPAAYIPLPTQHPHFDV